MVARVDFYVGRGSAAEWLGSYPFYGDPTGVFNADLFAERPVTEERWRSWVENWLSDPENRDRATLPEHGWPWPWEDSRTTDYAYAWDDGKVYGSRFGHRWFEVDPDADGWGQHEDDDGGKVAVFPDMSDRRAVTYSPRSGLITLSMLSAEGES